MKIIPNKNLIYKGILLLGGQKYEILDEDYAKLEKYVRVCHCSDSTSKKTQKQGNKKKNCKNC